MGAVLAGEINKSPNCHSRCIGARGERCCGNRGGVPQNLDAREILRRIGDSECNQKRVTSRIDFDILHYEPAAGDGGVCGEVGKNLLLDGRPDKYLCNGSGYRLAVGAGLAVLCSAVATLVWRGRRNRQ